MTDRRQRRPAIDEAHASARLPSAYFGLGLVWRIFAGYCQFLLRVGPSRRYLRETLLGCLDLCHGGIRSALARYFLHIVGLPPRAPTASTSRSKSLTRLNTRPARSTVNASTPPSRAAPHDSGPIWVANPLSYDFFIHYNLAGLTGAQERNYEELYPSCYRPARG